MNPIRTAVSLLLLLASLAVLPAPALAAGLEGLAAKSGSDFDIARFRFLKPRPAGDREVTASLVMGGARTGDGGLLGVELEFPLEGQGGWSIPVVLGGMGHKTESAYDAASGKWLQKSMGAGPTVGLRKRLFQAGVGTKDGKGVFIEPYVEIGAAPFAKYIDLSAATRKDLSTPEDKRWGIVETKQGANPMTQAAAGVDMHMNEGWSLGAEIRRVAPLFIKEHAAAFFNFSLKKDF